MKRTACMMLLLFFGTTVLADDKGTEVNLDGVKSVTPKEWVSEKPSNKLRFMQFKLPGEKDETAEIVIFQGITGSTKDNLERWKKTFIPPKDKTIDDIAKQTKMKIGGNEAVVLELSGTYKFKAAPFDPNSKEELKPDYKFYGVICETKDNIYHIRMVGPAKTVAKYEAGFMDWLKNFK